MTRETGLDYGGPKLVNQPSAAPTRKLWAVILAGMAAGAVQGGISAACGAGVELACAVPDVSDSVNVWATAGLMALAGYFTRERA